MTLMLDSPRICDSAFAKHQSTAHPGWRLIYYEAYLKESDARNRERRLKHHGSGIVELKKRLQGSLGISQTGAGSQ
jgi:hypothetical protein